MPELKEVSEAEHSMLGGASYEVGNRWETAMYRDKRGRLVQGPCVCTHHGLFRGEPVSVWTPCGPAREVDNANPQTRE